MKPLAWVSRVPLAGALGGALLLGARSGAITNARGQDKSAATAKDFIFARKILMGSIGDNMDELEGIIESGKIDVQHGASHADLVSVMLLAFPHLFPPASNEWKAGIDKDPGSDTFAAPEVWTR